MLEYSLASTIAAALLCAACQGEHESVGTTVQQPKPSLVEEWEIQAKNEKSINNCFLKIELPNPIYPSDYQKIRSRVENSKHTSSIPVFRVFSADNYDFVLLYEHCSDKSQVRLTILKSLREFNVDNIIDVSASEASEFITEYENDRRINIE